MGTSTFMSEKTYLLLLSVVLGSLGVAVWKMRAPSVAGASVLAPPSTLAKWPLAGATTHPGPRGVTLRSARDADGTDVDVVEFDFKANPKLKLELFDQDCDDARPFDNSARYWGRNAAYVLTRESKGQGEIVAACNGGPFNFDRSKTLDQAQHVAPLVFAGQRHFQNVVSRQSALWTFGVRANRTPKFEVVLRPSRNELKEFDFATGGAQCLVKDGQLLSIDEPPTTGKWPPFKAPSLQDAGSLGRDDWEKISRVSLGWNRDCSRLWMLCVHDPEAETVSRVALNVRVRGLANTSTPPVGGGWSLRDVQEFWKSKGVWSAVAVAGGDFAQFAAQRGDGQVEFVPSHVAASFWKTSRGRTRLVCKSDLKGAPTGGSALFYWIVRAKATSKPLQVVKASRHHAR